MINDIDNIEQLQNLYNINLLNIPKKLEDFKKINHESKVHFCLSNLTSTEKNELFKEVDLNGHSIAFFCNNDTKILDILVSNGCSINVRDSKGRNLLFYHYDDINMIKYLLKNNININETEYLSDFSILFYSHFFSFDIFELIISDKNINLNVYDKNGYHFLFHLKEKSKSRYDFIIKCLILRKKYPKFKFEKIEHKNFNLKLMDGMLKELFEQASFLSGMY